MNPLLLNNSIIKLITGAFISKSRKGKDWESMGVTNVG